MNTTAFILVVLVTGSMAGLVYATVGILVGGPYLEQAVELENQIMFEAGDAKDTPEFRAEYEEYRDWQQGGHLLSGIIYGISLGALFGIVFALSKSRLPGKSYLARSMFLAGVMYFVVYLLPSIKYPPNPPAVGEPETLLLRTILHLALVAIIGFGTVGFFKLARIQMISRLTGRMKSCIYIAGYAAFVTATYIMMPPSPDPPPLIQTSLLDGFRATSLISAGTFWIVMGTVLGFFWTRLARGEEPTQNLNSDSIH